MTFVTTLTFRSGDRAVLDDTVSGLKDRVERKGAECKGPHQEQPEHHAVPLYSQCQIGEEFGSWNYTVYTRWLEIHGSDHIAREVVATDLPDQIHVEVDVQRRATQAYR
jgi:ribosomal protein S10